MELGPTQPMFNFKLWRYFRCSCYQNFKMTCHFFSSRSHVRKKNFLK